MRISCSSPRRRLGWYPPLKPSKDLSEDGWFLQKESCFWGVCSVAMVCWYTRNTKEISKKVSVWWHHTFCWCKSRSRYRFISFCLEEVCFFSRNPVTLQEYLEDFVGFSLILQQLLVPSGFSSWLRMNMSWRWMWCVWDRWKVLWKSDISLMLGDEWDVDRMNNCGCQCLLSCWMWRFIYLYSILYISYVYLCRYE